MKTAKKPVYRSTPKQIRALASPLRIEIVGVFQNYGALSIRELAEKLERPADGLYHHIRQLITAEILRTESTRRIGKRDETVYTLTARRFGHETRIKTPAMRQAITDTADAALRLAAREFRQAIVDDGSNASPENPRRSAPSSGKLSRQKSWLTRADLCQLHEMLNEIDEFLQDRLKKRKGEPVVLTTVLAPVLKRKRF